MADEKRLSGESKIAVLSVLEKGGSILKHIFLNLSLPPVPTSAAGGNASPRGRFLPGGREEKKINEGDDEDRSILFGRHPNCHVVLDHPSISRFHLDRPVASLPRSRSSWDMDFGSKDSAERYCGHGGRIYKLQWLSTRRVMEMENLLEPVAEDKAETSHQDDCGDVVVGGRDKLPNVIPSVPPLPEFLS